MSKEKDMQLNDKWCSSNAVRELISSRDYYDVVDLIAYSIRVIEQLEEDIKNLQGQLSEANNSHNT